MMKGETIVHLCKTNISNKRKGILMYKVLIFRSSSNATRKYEGKI
uniref:Uncharacterized protein n=1 Tax=Rhizophora mucronata TaxID=61149 RepID=A0A2P2PNS1_RHIMU